MKQVLGMPDYARYLELERAKHPDSEALSEREFYEQYLAQRYSGGGLRCC